MAGALGHIGKEIDELADSIKRLREPTRSVRRSTTGWRCCRNGCKRIDPFRDEGARSFPFVALHPLAARRVLA
jgi:hypothetical protein